MKENNKIRTCRLEPYKRIALPALFLLGTLFVLKLEIRQLSTADESSRAPLSTIPPGRCPQLIEAAKYVVSDDFQDPRWHVAAIQLVGVWDTADKTETMNRVFEHNQRMLRHFNISLTRVTHAHDDITKHLSPAYWKMGAILKTCNNTSVDLVWFLDSDVLVMDPYARIEFLWAYHKQSHPEMFLLTANDWNEYNTGVFVVNCSAATGLLETWQRVAVYLHEHNDEGVYLFREQNTIHLMLNTSRWRREPNARQWNDELIAQFVVDGDDRDKYTTTALQQRIRHTTQCALNMFPPQGWNASWEKWDRRDLFLYSEGHFLLHTAGLRGQVRFDVLNEYASRETGSERMLSLKEAAKLYLETHPYEYVMEETLKDW